MVHFLLKELLKKQPKGILPLPKTFVAEAVLHFRALSDDSKT
jgi:hypothetical protein